MITSVKKKKDDILVENKQNSFIFSVDFSMYYINKFKYF